MMIFNQRKGSSRLRRIRLDRLLILLSILILFITGIIAAAHYAYTSLIKPHFNNYTTVANPTAAEPEIQFILTINPELLLSGNAILIEADTQTIIMAKNSQERIFPASLSKIMTTIAAIELIDDLNHTVLISQDVFSDLLSSDATTAGFLPDEEVKIMDLLYGAILPSGADACMMLALLASDSEQEFVGIMNRMAKDIGMKDTHFANTTGLHDSSHYSTAKDLALLLDYALKNPIFRTIFTAPDYTVAKTNKHPEGFTMSSTLFKRLEKPQFEDGIILGGKTGYTKEAGLCMASLAEKAGVELILVTAGAVGNYQSEPAYIYDAFTVYEGLKYELNENEPYR